MKKSSKPAIFLLITILIIITVFALVSVGLKLKYEQFLLQRDKAEKTFKSESQRKIKLTAEYQTVTAEERIVAVAKADLGLIRNIEPASIIKYDINKIEEINEILIEKYE
jgi:cell division protein FtsB